MNLVSTILIAALIDCLNPATIITQLLLLLKTKSLKISGTFIATTYIVYFISGLLLYYGVAAHLKTWFAGIEIKGVWIAIAESCLLVLCLYFLFKKDKHKEEERISGKKKLNEWAVMALGLGSTLSDVPTAVPYFAFIGNLEKIAPADEVIVISFLAYVLVYIMPMLIIHIIFLRNQEWVTKKALALEIWITRIGTWVGRLVLAALVTFLVVDILLYASGMDSILLPKTN